MRWAKPLTNVYIIGTLFTLLLFLTRLYLNTSFSIPLQISTSGAEEESIFAIWKFVHDQKIYQDFHQIPFAAAYFNWGFYAFYGVLVKSVLRLLSLSDEGIPSLGTSLNSHSYLVNTRS